jgi:hypothetical protein
MTRLGGLVLVAAALLAVPASASAASSVFGVANIDATPTGQDCSGCAIVTTTRADGTPELGSPISGIVTKVRLRTSGTAAVGLILLVRPTGNPLEFFNPGPDIPMSVTADATPAGHITEALTRRPVQAGDFVGIDFPDTVNSAANGPPRQCAYKVGGNAPGTTQTYTTASCNNNEFLVQATVESDADHDGYGDVTQDQCPTNASTHGACPAPVASTPAAKKKCKKKKHRSAEAAKKKCKKKHR